MNNSEKEPKNITNKGIIYIVFLLIVIVFIGSTGSLKKAKSELNKKPLLDISSSVYEENSTIISKVTYLDKQNKLINGDYRYKYKASTGSDEIYYEGEVKNHINTGYREHNDEIIKYLIEDGITYQIKDKDKIETDNLYIGFDKNLFDFTVLFDKVNSMSIIKFQEEESIRYSYKDNEYEYSVITDDESISYITIVHNGIETYEFKFYY